MPPLSLRSRSRVSTNNVGEHNSKSRSTSFPSKVQDAIAPNWSHDSRHRIVPYVESKLHGLREDVAMKCGKDQDEDFMLKREDRTASEEKSQALDEYHKRRPRENQEADKRLEWHMKREALERRKKNNEMKTIVGMMQKHYKKVNREEWKEAQQKWGSGKSDFGMKLVIYQKIREWTPGVET